MGEGESYQLEMMRCLREVNADNNTVGWWVGRRAARCSCLGLTPGQDMGRRRVPAWLDGSSQACRTLGSPPLHRGPRPCRPPGPRRYQSTISGSFQVVEIIETFVSYMESLERCVCIVYDATAAAGGALGVKAVRLSQAFVEAYREGGWALAGGRAGEEGGCLAGWQVGPGVGRAAVRGTSGPAAALQWSAHGGTQPPPLATPLPCCAAPTQARSR